MAAPRGVFLVAPPQGACPEDVRPLLTYLFGKPLAFFLFSYALLFLFFYSYFSYSFFILYLFFYVLCFLIFS
ncbi:hypothetical protein [Blackfly microvirus SF02]|uniref:Uncharacterized protein n=1 Tax=Blackfly microvirus SF02 TaxID=2576452 RepID=A0A4P8PJX0_9VIRU|nr:hypothetical protein [Blackfly microvirus SF02]